jgi:hypothetical protein
MTFIKRNARELAWVVFNALFAAFNLFMSAHTAWPGLYAVFFAAHVACGGFWVWCIFDNAYTDALEADIERMTADLERTEDPYLTAEVRRTLNGEEAQ